MKKLAVCILGCSVLFLLATRLKAQEPPAEQEVPPEDLVRSMVQAELADRGKHAWQYRLRKVEAGRVHEYETVRTPEGTFRKLVAVDGHPPSPEQKAKNDAELAKMSSDGAYRAEQLRKEQENIDRVRRLLRLLPDAFLFEYDTVHAGIARIHFKPNPRFKPPTKEARVFSAMEGTLEIDLAEKRMRRLEGKLTRDVDFAWGLLGNLKRGGTFSAEQSRTASGAWLLSEMKARIDGRAMLFYGLNVNEDSKMTDFQMLPAETTIAEALQKLGVR